jgi:aminoglycoside phosphotransferase (APT) family kinase protein
MGTDGEFTEENFVRATKRANDARVLARALAPQLQNLFPGLFSTPPHVEAVTEQGWFNLTLFLGTQRTQPEYVLRLASVSALPNGVQSRSLPHLEKERFVLEQLRDFDFTAKLVEPGTGRCTVHIPGRGLVDYAFMLQTRLPWPNAKQRESTLVRSRYLWQLGEIARSIQQIPMKGFGNDFSERERSFACKTNQEMIRAYVKTIEESPIDFSMKRWLAARVETLLKLSPEPRLAHRDLLGNLGNVLVDDSGTVRGVIDWEFASSGLAFHAELASFLFVLYRDGVSPEQIRMDRSAFLSGYGISEKDYQEHYERDVESIVMIHSLMALIKFDALVKKGGLEREPWREVFAKRAGKLCADCYSKDATGRRVRIS